MKEKDIMFLKEYKHEDRLWENNPHLAFVLTMPVLIAMMIGTGILSYKIGIKIITIIFSSYGSSCCFCSA